MAAQKATQAKEWWEEINAANLKTTTPSVFLAQRCRRAKGKNSRCFDSHAALSAGLPNQVSVYFTRHAQQRMAQRNLSDEEIKYVLLHGQTWHKAGVIIMHLRQKDIPRTNQTDQRCQQLIGATVILSTGNRSTVITAYRDRQSGLKQIKNKPDYGWKVNRRG